MMLGFGMGIIGIIVMILIIAAVLLGGVWFVRGLFPSGDAPKTADRPRSLSPREILDQRYARGEIARPEYEAIKADLDR